MAAANLLVCTLCWTLGMALAITFHLEADDTVRTPEDFVDKVVPNMPDMRDTGLPAVSSYEVEEDYPEDDFEGAESNIYTAFNPALGGLAIGVNRLGLGNGLGYTNIGLGGLGVANAAVNVPQAGALAINQGLIGGVGPFQGGGLGITGGVGATGGFLYQPIFGLHGGQVGGAFIDQKGYDAAEKKAGDVNVAHLVKKSEEEAKQGEEGFQQGSLAAKSDKADAAFYKDEEAKKKAAGDEKVYEGAQKFDKAGGNEEALKSQKSHKKGHVTKGFKSSSSKNEEEKTETFYDEAHDAGDHKHVNQHQGSFGENAVNAYKGNHEEKVLDAKNQGKEGHFNAIHHADDAKANKGQYAQNAYKGGAEQVEKSNNLGAHSVHGHQEATGQFQQHKPYGILPIHGD